MEVRRELMEVRRELREVNGHMSYSLSSKAIVRYLPERPKGVINSF